MDVRIDFERLPWESPAPGMRSKTFLGGGSRIRLVEFTDGFEEREWCTRPHAFHVLEGELSLRLRNGGEVRMRAGDVGLLPAGDGAGHKAVLGRGERALLLLFESAGPDSPTVT